MGAAFSSRWNPFRPPEDIPVLMLGLDGAGKTTFLFRLRPDTLYTYPPIGFSIETLSCRGLSITVWDLNRGNERARPLWVHYFRQTRGLIFVVDSGDRESLDEARAHLQRLTNEPLLAGVPLLVWANKSDVAQQQDLLGLAQMASDLRLHDIRGREWHILASSAVTGEGLHEGIRWMGTAIMEFPVSH